MGKSNVWRLRQIKNFLAISSELFAKVRLKVDGKYPDVKYGRCIASRFARDVTEPMLAVKNKSVSFRWELNSIFKQILQKSYIVLTTSMAALSRGCKLRIVCQLTVYIY